MRNTVESYLLYGEERVMNNQEAIEIIKSHYPSENYTLLREALDMAIKSLENEEFLSTHQNKPSDKQLNTISIIESNLDVEFTGKTKQEASNFITKYIEQSKNTVTDKQWEVIHMIQDNTGEKFNGKTKTDARSFIDENIYLSIEKSKHEKEYRRIKSEEEDWHRERVERIEFCFDNGVYGNSFIKSWQKSIDDRSPY